MVVSCKGTKSDCAVDRTIECRESQIRPDIPEYVKEVTFLPLEAGDNTLLGSVDKVAFYNDLIYIADYSSRKILAYDMNGKLCFVLDRQGRGPGEYLEVKSFTVDSDNLYVLDNIGKKLLAYDPLTGEYKASREMPIVAWDVEVLSNGDLIFAFVTAGGKLSKEQPPYRLFVTDNDLNIKIQMLGYGEKEALRCASAMVVFSPLTGTRSCSAPTATTHIMFWIAAMVRSLKQSGLISRIKHPVKTRMMCP